MSEAHMVLGFWLVELCTFLLAVAGDPCRLTGCRASCDAGDCDSGEYFNGSSVSCGDGHAQCGCCAIPAGCRMTDCRASCDSGDCKSGELFTGLAQACDDGGDSCECCLVPAGCRMTDCRASCDTGDCKSGEFFTGVTQDCDDGREACECCNASPTPTPPPPVPTPTPPAPTPPPPTPVPSAGVHDPFGGTWYKGTADDSKYSVSFTSTSVTWNFQNTHLENDGIATHFDPVPLEQDETVSFLMVWNSGAPPYDRDGCTSKYWTESKYEYQCYDEGGGTDSYPWVVDGCRKEPAFLLWPLSWCPGFLVLPVPPGSLCFVFLLWVLLRI